MSIVKPVIHLLGDAILDNYYSLSDRSRDLKKELTDLGFTVNNCAVDDVKVANIINGIVPNEKYTKSRSYPYPIEAGGKMQPLKSVLDSIGVTKAFTSVYSNIQPQAIGKSVQNDDMVVISMGGGDIYDKIKSILLGGEYFINSVLTPEFIANFRKVIDGVRKSCSKIVLVSIYLPFLGTASSYALYSPFATTVMNKWNAFINSIAKEYNIPVLDLSRTLNIGTREHYGTDDTRVSNVSNKCMAECLAYIHSHYSGHHIYYCPNCDSSKIIVE